MAELIIKETSTGTETTLQDVDLNMTNRELIEGLITEGILHRLAGGQQHLVVAKDNSVSEETKTLIDLGYTESDIVKIVTKDVGA